MHRESSTSRPGAAWSRRAKSALLRAVALARTALIEARGQLAASPLTERRRAANHDRLLVENALLREELRIKDARLARIPAHRRPHHEPVERLAILALRAAAGWSAAETARRFRLAPATIAAWTRRLDEAGPDALVRTREPVNRFPELVAEIVLRLRATIPAMGKVRIAQVLARAGLEIAPTTVGRFLTRPPRRPQPARPVAGSTRPPAAGEPSGRVVTARYAHHLWHVDLTVVPTAGGFWVPWLPLSLPVVWPFAWTIAVVLDHHSRAVVACAVFRKQPSAAAICALLDRAILDAGRAPRHLVTDRGAQFQGEYLAWCERRRVRPRFGAVGRKGSIAVVERFIRSLKDECLRRTPVSLEIAAVRRELDAYVGWYNACRPHSALGVGVAPSDRLARPRALPAAFETRPRYPLRRRGKRRRRRRLRGTLRLLIEHHRGRLHLPVVTLREAA
jgi:transposase InsO family protein